MIKPKTMEKQKENNIDVFEEANNQFIKQLKIEGELGRDPEAEKVELEEKAELTKLKIAEQKKNLLAKAIDRTPKGRRETWENFLADLDTVHTERMNHILKTCPDKDFPKLFFKALEFTKPKLMRDKKEDEGDGDNLIQVVIKKSSGDTTKTIDITHIEDD